MLILATILDPADNGFDISDLSVLLGVVLLISGTTATIVRWNAKRREAIVAAERADMEERIKVAVEFVAAKVQPKNGGLGWTDVHNKLDAISDRQGEVISDLTYLRGRMDAHIDNHGKA